MKDNLQGISLDRYLIRAKDIVLLLISLGSMLSAGYVAIIYVVRMNDKLIALERQLSEMRMEMVEIKNMREDKDNREWNVAK